MQSFNVLKCYRTIDATNSTTKNESVRIQNDGLTEKKRFRRHRIEYKTTLNDQRIFTQRMLIASEKFYRSCL